MFNMEDMIKKVLLDIGKSIYFQIILRFTVFSSKNNLAGIMINGREKLITVSERYYNLEASIFNQLLAYIAPFYKLLC